MRIARVAVLEDFGNRSLVLHGIMAITFANAILVGSFVGGEFGVAAFFALLSGTAGLWVAHSIHSLGTVAGGSEYTGVLNELFDTGGASRGFDVGRFGRLLVLIGAVSAISLLTSAQALSGIVFSTAVVVVGTVALITALVGFLIALGASYDETQGQLSTHGSRDG